VRRLSCDSDGSLRNANLLISVEEKVEDSQPLAIRWVMGYVVSPVVSPNALHHNA